MSRFVQGIEKRITFDSVNSVGQCFAEAIDITPRGGGGLEKIAGRKHPEVERFLRSLKSDPAYQYVLMTPMGSFEFWGMNVNGDVFPEISLAFDLVCDDPIPVARDLEERWLRPHGKRLPPGLYKEFGHKTFLQANRYRHHVNKDPSISYGGIVLSVWNPMMHRVEVIARHDREAAKRVGAEEIIVDLDDGKPRQISMGCKVPFDVCTKCGHISRTPRDYCEHLKYAMGQVNKDGSINGAVNFFPRFFDLSDVFVPAAKESGVLEKVANARGTVINKWAGDKQAEIKKEILPNAGHKSVQDCIDSEPDLPKRVLEHGHLADLLKTLTSIGIIMKPHEFQHASLHRMGLGRYSEELDRKNMVFRPSRAGGLRHHMGGRFQPGLAEALSSVLKDRSAFYPHLPERVMRIVVIKAKPNAPRTHAPDSEPLKKVAQAYDSYRRSLRDLPDILDVAVRERPGYYGRHFFGDLLTDSMEKMAGSAHGMSLSTPMVPLYVYSAYRGPVTEPPASWELPTSDHSPARALLSNAL
jgi:hypothetical protein